MTISRKPSLVRSGRETSQPAATSRWATVSRFSTSKPRLQRALAGPALSRAISSVNSGIDYDRTHYTPGRGRHDSDFDENSLRPVAVAPDQPNMVAARNFLNAAIANLNRASADKGGYGLGLFLVKEIMAAHGGAIEVKSQVGKGSTFRLFFPLSKEELLASHASSSK